MNQPSENEINERLALYMGLECDLFPCGSIGVVTKTKGVQTTYTMDLFTASLDACVPIVEKLITNEIEVYYSDDEWKVNINDKNIHTGSNTPALALSTALYFAIGEIE